MKKQMTIIFVYFASECRRFHGLIHPNMVFQKEMMKVQVLEETPQVRTQCLQRFSVPLLFDVHVEKAPENF